MCGDSMGVCGDTATTDCDIVVVDTSCGDNISCCCCCGWCGW